MGQYKVPQNVEAEDKILGPFSFRQFVYLLIGIGAGALVYFMGAVLLPLALIPLPVCVLGLALALPLRKDQPMETYLIAVFRFHTKPKKRLWVSGSGDTTVEIMAAVTNDTVQLKEFDSSEASKRLQFLSQVVDTGGWSTRGVDAPETVNSNIDTDAANAVITQADAHDMFNENGQLSESIGLRLAGKPIPDIANQNSINSDIINSDNV